MTSAECRLHLPRYGGRSDASVAEHEAMEEREAGRASYSITSRTWPSLIVPVVIASRASRSIVVQWVCKYLLASALVGKLRFQDAILSLVSVRDLKRNPLFYRFLFNRRGNVHRVIPFGVPDQVELLATPDR